jgi:membrane glycosyltransferase
VFVGSVFLGAFEVFVAAVVADFDFVLFAGDVLDAAFGWQVGWSAFEVDTDQVTHCGNLRGSENRPGVAGVEQVAQQF